MEPQKHRRPSLSVLFLCRQTDSGESSYINLNTNEISRNHPYNEKFSRKVIKERERLVLGKKEGKTSEKKNRSSTPSSQV